MSSTDANRSTSNHGVSHDPEKGLHASSSLVSTTLSWNDVTFRVKGRETPILSGISGNIRSGELLAVMGPSGAGKSTFLDVLCKRVPATSGEILFDGSTHFKSRDVFSFVEQDDALFGVLTVRETVAFAARLSLPRDTPDLDAHIDATLKSLGLQDVAHNRIGTPFQRGISGGQKRRVTIACSMVSRPRVLVLDEPTSGLDALSGREVIAAVKRLAKETNTICIATIHQPNYETFALFDSLLLLAGGRVMFNGPSDSLESYLADVLHMPTPVHSNPADHAVEVVNTEFFTAESTITATEHLDNIARICSDYSATKSPQGMTSNQADTGYPNHASSASGFKSTLHKTGVLVQRNFFNYRRNLLAFGIRSGMYVAMGFLLATVWIRLPQDSNNLQNRLSVYFFSVAFLGFMSVSGIPSFLEERAVFIRERANGLYTPGSYVVANTVTVVPFLFISTLLFSVIMYWAIGLHSGAVHFFRFLIYLFLGVLAAEFQSILIAVIIPIFVAALAIASFANGLWMVVQGYFISAKSLPAFWYYTFHFIDYQTFAFELLARNDLLGLDFPCPVIDNVCTCPMTSSLVSAGQCALAGSDVIENLGYGGVNDGLYAGILIIIIVVFRLMTWGVLVWRKR